MNYLDPVMEYLVVGVFLCVGFAKISRFNRRPKPLGAQRASYSFGSPYASGLAIGIFEIVAASALLISISFHAQIIFAQLAVVGLALLTMSAAFYHMRRRETAVPNIILFLLVMFVAVARWM